MVNTHTCFTGSSLDPKGSHSASIVLRPLEIRAKFGTPQLNNVTMNLLESNIQVVDSVAGFVTMAVWIADTILGLFTRPNVCPPYFNGKFNPFIADCAEDGDVDCQYLLITGTG